MKKLKEKEPIIVIAIFGIALALSMAYSISHGIGVNDLSEENASIVEQDQSTSVEESEDDGNVYNPSSDNIGFEYIMSNQGYSLYYDKYTNIVYIVYEKYMLDQKIGGITPMISKHGNYCKYTKETNSIIDMGDLTLVIDCS